MYYAGIGSRETPLNVLTFFENMGVFLEKKGYILRTGGAKGADQAFSKYVKNKEVFLPWNGYEDQQGICNITQEALNLIPKYHPAPQYLSQGAKRMMARNAQIILGEYLDKPVEFVICYQTNASKGGTRFGMNMAKDLGIEIYNMFKEQDYLKLKERFSET